MVVAPASQANTIQVQPSISGTPQVGQTLTVNPGTWRPKPSRFDYAWQRCDANGGACVTSPTSSDSQTYVLTSGDAGYRIVALVAADGAWSSAVATAPTATVTGGTGSGGGGTAPVNTSAPLLSGTAQAGQTLSVTNGTWFPTPTSYLYAWHRCNSTGCTLSPTSTNSPTYALTSGDVGFQIVAQVAPNGLWTSSVDSLPSATVTAASGGSGGGSGTPVNTSLPVLSGTAQVGQTLSVTNGTWSPTPTSYLYAWHRCTSSGCSLSPTSTNSTSYTLTSGDVGYQIVAQVAPNGIWSASVDSALSAVVTAPAGTTSSANPIAVYRLGSSYAGGSNYDKYGYVIVSRGDAATAAALPGKALVYMSGVDISTSFSTGVDYTTALNNGWLLKDASGNYMTGYGSYLGDVGSTAYQQAWASSVASFLSSTGADGIYIDDVLSNISTWSNCGCFPAKYPSQSAWQTAMANWMSAVGSALKAKGYYVVASAHAYIPGNSASDDGSLEAAWWRQLAPSVSGLSTEYFTENQGNPSQLRSLGSAWYQHWDGWQGLVSVAQGAGVDFFGLTYGTSTTTGIMRYMKASFLIDWNGRGGAVMFQTTDGSDPWNLTWTANVGTPTGGKVQIASGVWQRQFSAGTVVVNANPFAVTVTVNGVARTIAATDGLILTQ